MQLKLASFGILALNFNGFLLLFGTIVMDLFGQNSVAVLVLISWFIVCSRTNRSYAPLKAVMPVTCIPEIGTVEAVLVILYDAVARFPRLSQLVPETKM